MIVIKDTSLKSINAIILQAKRQIEVATGYKAIVTYALVEEQAKYDNMGDQVNAILTAIAKHYDISVMDLKNKNLKTKFVDARFTAFKILHKDFYLSKSQIARLLSRDHTTIIHGLRKFESYYQTDDTFRENHDIILQKIKNK